MNNVFTEKLGPAPMYMWGLGGIAIIVMLRLFRGSGSSAGQTALVQNPSIGAGSGSSTGTSGDSSGIAALLTQLGTAEQQSFQQLSTALTSMGKQQQDSMLALGQAELAQNAALGGAFTALGKSQSDQLAALTASITSGQQSLQQQLLAFMTDSHTPVAQPTPPVYNPNPGFTSGVQNPINVQQSFVDNLYQLLARAPTPLPGQQLNTGNFLNYNTLGARPNPADLVVINNTGGSQSLASRNGAGVPVLGPNGQYTYFRPQIAIN